MSPTHEPGGGLPPLGELLRETTDDLKANFVGYALAALGATLVMTPLALVLVVVLTFGLPALLVVGAGAGLSAADGIADAAVAGWARLGVLFGTFGAGLVGFVGMFAALGAVLAPMTASLQRAIAAHQRGEGALGFTSMLTTWSQDLVAVMGASAALMLTTMFGLPLCYVGYFVALFLFGFAPTMVALHRRGAFDALRTCARHALAHPIDHGIFMAVWFAGFMIATYIPVIGTAVLYAIQVRAYRKLFGDGDVPAL